MCFQKLKKLFVDPAKFFKEVAKEKGYWTVLKFFVSITVVTALIQTLVSIATKDILVILPFILTALIVGIVFGFVIPFIVSLIAHLGVLIICRKKNYFNTFKAITYGLIISVIYGVISFIIYFVLGFSIDNLSVSNSAREIISLIGFVHMIIAQTIGVSMYHSISRIKAFFGIILVPLIIIVLLVIIGSAFFLGLV